MCEVYRDVHKHIENRSDNEDVRRYLKWKLVSETFGDTKTPKHQL